MRKSTRGDETGGEYVDTVIVEAVNQDLFCPRSVPNASLNYLVELLHMVSPDITRIIAAPMSSVRRMAHVGMMVDSVQASCVLSLLAHAGRSETVNLEGGHKLISRRCWSDFAKLRICLGKVSCLRIRCAVYSFDAADGQQKCLPHLLSTSLRTTHLVRAVLRIAQPVPRHSRGMRGERGFEDNVFATATVDDVLLGVCGF